MSPDILGYSPDQPANKMIPKGPWEYISTLYLHGEGDNVLVQKQKGTNFTEVETIYIYGSTGLIVRLPADKSTNPDEKYYVMKDHSCGEPVESVGSTRVVMDKDWDLVSYYDYMPFGSATSNTSQIYAADYQYTSQAGAKRKSRYFIGIDPLWANYPSISPYVRVANNLMIYTDPTGTIIEFQNEDEALKTAEEINSLHNNETNITVTSSERTSKDIIGTIKNIFSGNFSIATKTQTIYQLSTSKSSFDWGQNEYTSALYDVVFP